MGFYEQVAQFIINHEGYRDKPYWDTNAYRIGFGSDTITTSKSGEFRKVVKGDVTTKELAAIDLQRRIRTEFEPKIRGQIGAQYYDKLSDNSKIALLSLAYNYGSITKQAIINAARTLDDAKIAQAIVDSTANDNKSQSAQVQKVLKERRQKEANFILSAAKKGVQLAKEYPIITIALTTTFIVAAYILITQFKKK